MTLATGKKIQVPFEQLIIFSTNLEPLDLADEAFLRRIPYKIEVGDPSIAEFAQAVRGGVPDVRLPVLPGGRPLPGANALPPHDRPLRRCQPRDLLAQIENYCAYNGRPMELRPDYLDRVVKSYFTAVAAGRHGRAAPTQAATSAADSTASPAHRNSAIRNPIAQRPQPQLRIDRTSP